MTSCSCCDVQGWVGVLLVFFIHMQSNCSQYVLGVAYPLYATAITDMADAVFAALTSGLPVKQSNQWKNVAGGGGEVRVVGNAVQQSNGPKEQGIRDNGWWSNRVVAVVVDG